MATINKLNIPEKLTIKKDSIKLLAEEMDKKVDFTLTLGNILEVLDGILENSGRILIITTNNIDKLDRALMRPGRIDKIIEFKLCNISILIDIISNFYKDKSNLDLIKSKIHMIPEYIYSPAYIINKCCQYKDTPFDLINDLNNNCNISNSSTYDYTTKLINR